MNIHSKVKIVLVGFGKFGEEAFKSILKNKFSVVKVIIPSSTGFQEIEDIARKNKIISTKVLNKKQLEEELLHTNLDIIVVASCPYLFSENIIMYPRLGMINIHGALLPKFRGHHPVHWALIKGEENVGVTIHYIDKGADSGNILGQKKILIKNSDDINTVIGKIAKEGSLLLIKLLKKIEKTGGLLQGIPQDNAQASFAPRRHPEEGKIFWKSSTRDIFNLIRALKDPYPNAFSFTKNDEKVEVSSSYISKNPGTVLAKVKGYYLVSTSDGVILIKTKMPLKIGEILE